MLEYRAWEKACRAEDVDVQFEIAHVNLLELSQDYQDYNISETVRLPQFFTDKEQQFQQLHSIISRYKKIKWQNCMKCERIDEKDIPPTAIRYYAYGDRQQ